MIDRSNPHRTLAVVYLLGGLAIYLIGTASHGFALFALLYMREPLRLDFLWAGLCLVGAAYFMFRNAGVAG